MTDKFYVIKIINNRTGQRGYIMDTPKGIMIVQGGLMANITQFNTEKEARFFAKQNRLERKGVTIHIRTNEDLIKDGGSDIKPAEGNMYYIENSLGHKMFYYAEHEGYGFENKDVGYCFWKSREDADKFIIAMEFPPDSGLVVKEMNNKTVPETN